MTEIQLQDYIEKYFSKYFDVYREVWSTCKTKRIDMILIHKSDNENKYPIGIEVKRFENKRGVEIGEWIKQAYNYSKIDFSTFGKVLTLICPQISGNYFNEGDSVNKHDPHGDISHQNNVATFLSAFNIGEVQKYTHKDKNYIKFAFRGQIIWENKTNILRLNNYNRLCKR